MPLLSFAAASLLTFGCRAQQPAPLGRIEVGKPLPPDVAFRVEALLRRKADLPPASTINLSAVSAAGTPGFDTVTVSFTNEGRTSHPIEFLISQDGAKLEQITSFELPANPGAVVSAAGRPARGGPSTAPVTIVGFDDLECPFCARLHQSIFPAIQNRYGDKVHIVYRDFPLAEIHPWAKHAAVDVECLAAQSPGAYWSAVDALHAQFGQIGADPADAKAEKTVDRANQQVDTIVRAQGAAAHVDTAKLNECLQKQDTKDVDASIAMANGLNLQSAPILFINGDKVDGAVPIEFIFDTIDRALRAQGMTPPPPMAPAPVAAPVAVPAASAPKGR